MIGRIIVWEARSRLVLRYEEGGHENQGTEVEVRFEEAGDGTKVTLEHRGWVALAPEVASRSRETKR